MNESENVQNCVDDLLVVIELSKDMADLRMVFVSLDILGLHAHGFFLVKRVLNMVLNSPLYVILALILYELQ